MRSRTTDVKSNFQNKYENLNYDKCEKKDKQI